MPKKEGTKNIFQRVASGVGRVFRGKQKSPPAEAAASRPAASAADPRYTATIAPDQDLPAAAARSRSASPASAAPTYTATIAPDQDVSSADAVPEVERQPSSDDDLPMAQVADQDARPTATAVSVDPSSGQAAQSPPPGGARAVRVGPSPDQAAQPAGARVVSVGPSYQQEPVKRQADPEDTELKVPPSMRLDGQGGGAAKPSAPHMADVMSADPYAGASAPAAPAQPPHFVPGVPASAAGIPTRGSAPAPAQQSRYPQQPVVGYGQQPQYQQPPAPVQQDGYRHQPNPWVPAAAAMAAPALPQQGMWIPCQWRDGLPLEGELPLNFFRDSLRLPSNTRIQQHQDGKHYLFVSRDVLAGRPDLASLAPQAPGAVCYAQQAPSYNMYYSQVRQAPAQTPDYVPQPPQYQQQPAAGYPPQPTAPAAQPAGVPGHRAVMVQVVGGFQNLDQHYIHLAKQLKAQGANQVGLCAATNMQHHNTWALQQSGRYDPNLFHGGGQMNTVRGVFTSPNKPDYLHPLSVPSVGMGANGLVPLSQQVSPEFNPLEQAGKFIDQPGNMVIMQVQDLNNPGASYLPQGGITQQMLARRGGVQAVSAELAQGYVQRARSGMNAISPAAAHYRINTQLPPGHPNAIQLVKPASPPQQVVAHGGGPAPAAHAQHHQQRQQPQGGFHPQSAAAAYARQQQQQPAPAAGFVYGQQLQQQPKQPWFQGAANATRVDDVDRTPIAGHHGAIEAPSAAAAARANQLREEQAAYEAKNNINYK